MSGPEQQAAAKKKMWDDLIVHFSTASGAKVFYLLTRVALPPLTLSFVTLEEYGIWAACFVLIGYIGMSTFGVANVYIRYVAEFAARRDFDRINRLVSTGVLISGSVSMITFLALWSSLPSVCGLLKLPVGMMPVAMNLVLGAAAVFLIEVTFGAFGHVLYGLQKIQQHQGVWVAAFLLEGCLIVTLLFAGSGIYALLWSFLARYIFTTVAYYVLVRRAIPEFKLSVRLLDRASIRLLFTTGGVYQLAGVLGMFLYSVEKLIASVFLGVGAVALFDIGQKFPVTGSQVISTTNNLFLPAISRMQALSWSDEIRKLYLRGSRYMNLCAGLLMGFLAAFSLPLLSTWLGSVDSINVAAQILVVFTIAFQLHVLTGPASSIHRAGNKPQREFVYHLPQLVLVALSTGLLYLTVGFSTLAIAVAISASMAASALLYSIYSNRILGISSHRYLMTVLLPGCSPYLAGYCVRALTDSWWDWQALTRWESLACLGVAGVLYLLLATTLIGSFHLLPEEKARLVRAFRAARQLLNRIPVRVVPLTVWLLVIFFSSTGLAMSYAYSIFDLSVDMVGVAGKTSSARLIVQKLFHSFLFAILGFLLWRLRSETRLLWIAHCVGLCFLVGATSELLQIFFDSRQPTVFDFLLNGASGTTAVWLTVQLARFSTWRLLSVPNRS
jgi:O-antigen/teichoic acid export membrane protein/VanZ family protein